MSEFDPLSLLERLGRFVAYTFIVLGAVPTALVRRAGECLRQFERAAWGGLFLALAAGTSVGLVGWMQLRRLLDIYQAGDALPGALAAAVLVEIGPVLASLLLAARLGAGLAAELGTLVLTEQVDARTVLGASVPESLIAPRAVGAALAAPLLVITLDVAALAAALAAELVGGSLTPEAFIRRSFDGLWLRDVVPATLKTALFGLLVGLVACWAGLHVDRSTEAVGHAATRGVVYSALAVFLADALCVPVIHALVDGLNLQV
jgi:phospholipid/cholesterol/gamma-HCH transport system permease protein